MGNVPSAGIALLHRGESIVPGRPRPLRLEVARGAIRDVERFCLIAKAEAEGEDEVNEAQGLLRLAVGLRRALDRFKGRTDG